MKSNLLSCLCCPQDRSLLRLYATRSTAIEALDGELQCKECGCVYPIDLGIPRFVTAQQNELCALQKSEMDTHDSRSAAKGA